MALIMIFVAGLMVDLSTDKEDRKLHSSRVLVGVKEFAGS